MRKGKSRRARAYLSRGGLYSLLLHTHLLAPLLIAAWVYGGRQEAQRPEEIDVAFEDVAPEELPTSLPPIDDLPDVDKSKPKPNPNPPLAHDKKKKADSKDATKPEPEVVVPEEMPPMPAPPPAPPPERRAHEKMVDLDNDKEVEPPPDAKYLAQKNNRAVEETRATDTNLEKAQKGEQADSTPSEREDTEVGGEKAKIAELEEQKSLAGKKAPDVTPHADPQLADAPRPPSERSPLALRDPAPRTHELTPETADPSLPHTPDGDVAAPQRAVRGQTSDPARGKSKRVKLALSSKDYEYLFGAEAEAERRLAQKTRSTKVGKFAQRQARIRADLENFIPEVKPGNQTALNTRAAPFAAYIARMHRSIHQLWGFGQLEDWDEKPGSNPFNDPNLFTTLEMVLNGDGTIDHVMIAKSSGYLPYDVAAMDVAYSAGPYPDAPREIRSANGKIYIHWRFHRDGRQCATSGVDYYILDNPPAGGDKPAVAELPAAASQPSVPQPIGGAPSGDAAGPRRLQRSEQTAMHRHAVASGGGEGEGAGAATPAPAEKHAPTPGLPPSAVVRADDPGARAIADRWFSALAHGDAGAMAEIAAFPFKTSAGVDVKNRGELTAMLKDLIAESPLPRGAASLQVYTGAGARGALGRLPPGLDGTGSLFVIAPTTGHDALILVLARRTGIWKAVGLVRR